MLKAEKNTPSMTTYISNLRYLFPEKDTLVLLTDWVVLGNFVYGNIMNGGEAVLFVGWNQLKNEMVNDNVL